MSTVRPESVGKKMTILGLKQPHTALFPHGRNGQTWEGKSTPTRVLPGSFTQLTEEEKDPKISSSYFFSRGSSWREGSLNLQKQPSEKVSSPWARKDGGVMGSALCTPLRGLIQMNSSSNSCTWLFPMIPMPTGPLPMSCRVPERA